MRSYMQIIWPRVCASRRQPSLFAIVRYAWNYALPTDVVMEKNVLVGKIFSFNTKTSFPPPTPTPGNKLLNK